MCRKCVEVEDSTLRSKTFNGDFELSFIEGAQVLVFPFPKRPPHMPILHWGDVENTPLSE